MKHSIILKHVDRETHLRIVKWCEDRIGIKYDTVKMHSGYWGVFWINRKSYEWAFVNASDLTMFLLAWGHLKS